MGVRMGEGVVCRNRALVRWGSERVGCFCLAFFFLGAGAEGTEWSGEDRG
jgi:hypothetical protein